MPDETGLWELVADGREGILATMGVDGQPQLSNTLYVVDAAARTVRMSSTDDWVKDCHVAGDGRA
jgi:hypothetical protein